MEPDAFTALSAELAVAAGSVKYRRHSWDSTRHSAAAAHGTHPLSVRPSDVRPLWQRPLDEGAASETDKHRRGRGGGGGEGARTTALAARAAFASFAVLSAALLMQLLSLFLSPLQSLPSLPPACLARYRPSRLRSAVGWWNGDGTRAPLTKYTYRWRHGPVES